MALLSSVMKPTVTASSCASPKAVKQYVPTAQHRPAKKLPVQIGAIAAALIFLVSGTKYMMPCLFANIEGRSVRFREFCAHINVSISLQAPGIADATPQDPKHRVGQVGFPRYPELRLCTPFAICPRLSKACFA